MSWKLVQNLDEIHKGDIVQGINYTHSQKYFNLEGYEHFNSTREGEVVSENNKNFFDIIIMNKDNLLEKLVYDCGTSGEWYVYKK